MTRFIRTLCISYLRGTYHTLLVTATCNVYDEYVTYNCSTRYWTMSTQLGYACIIRSTNPATTHCTYP